MVVIGSNLLELIESEGICSSSAYDKFSISLTLGKTIFRAKTHQDGVLRYGSQDVSHFYKREELDGGALIVDARESVLASSHEKIKMPLGYIGLLQTKGTLARMFMLAHCSDSQIEPGFSGAVTLELCNLSPWPIEIPIGSPVAQMFLLRCSTGVTEGYSGKYADSDIPTIPVPILKGP